MPRVPHRRRFKHKKRSKCPSTSLPRAQKNIEDNSAAADTIENNEETADVPSVTSLALDHAYCRLAPSEEAEDYRTSSPLASPNSVADDISLPGNVEDWVSSSGNVTPSSLSDCESLRSSTPVSRSSSRSSSAERTSSSTLNVDTSTPSLRKDLYYKLLLLLPANWMPVIEANGVNVLLLSRNAERAVQRRLYFSVSGDVKLSVHCEPVPVEGYLQNVRPAEELTQNTLSYFADRVLEVVMTVRQLEICSGADHSEYKTIWPSIEHAVVDKNPYQESRYNETLRSSKCLKLVESRKWRCKHCAILVNTLRRKTRASAEPHRNTPNIHLTEEQKLDKLHDQRKELDNKKRQLDRLQSKMQLLLKRDGVNVDSQLNNDLKEILGKADLSPTQALFLQQQMKASSVKKSSAIRWHPTMIRFALALQSASNSAYETIQASGMIKLPSQRLLFDYSHYKSSGEGIDLNIINNIHERLVKECPEDYQRFHSLLCDEMHISKNLVFQKSTGRLVGYSNLSQLDEEMEKLKKHFEGEDVTYDTPLASKILAFMVKGVANNVKEVVASFSVASLVKEKLYIWSWSLICMLERAGIRIVAYVCDGSAVNRGFIKMNKPVTKTDSGVVFDTINKAAPDRTLYFISDVPHLLKTARNCLANSSTEPKKPRCLQKNGQKLLWKDIIRLYLSKRDKVLRKSYKLNAQAVFLNSFSCMKVCYAAHVLSRTVAKDIEKQGWAGTQELVKFIIFINDWFDCLNGAHSQHGIRTKNERLNPYVSADDPRFEFLQSFLDYLKEWEAEAYHNKQPAAASYDEDELLSETIADVTTAPHEATLIENTTPPSRKILSRQTLEGIEMTTKAFISLAKYLLGHTVGMKWVNARAFCQDPLEQYFSKQRYRCGGSTNPNVGQFHINQTNIHVQGVVGVKKGRGNTEQKKRGMEITTERLPKRKSLFNLV